MWVNKKKLENLIDRRAQIVLNKQERKWTIWQGDSAEYVVSEVLLALLKNLNLELKYTPLRDRTNFVLKEKQK